VGLSIALVIHNVLFLGVNKSQVEIFVRALSTYRLIIITILPCLPGIGYQQFIPDVEITDAFRVRFDIVVIIQQADRTGSKPLQGRSPG